MGNSTVKSRVQNELEELKEKNEKLGKSSR